MTGHTCAEPDRPLKIHEPIPLPGSHAVCTPPATKVAIVGSAPSSAMLAPFDDESIEIWTLANMPAIGAVPRSTRHFELHPLSWLQERKRYWPWLVAHTSGRLYLREADERIPNSEVFPAQELVARFGRYFTNTVSWMIAYAAHCNVSAIHVYGVDMAANTEYGDQRASCEYFLGLATGLGIEVYVPPQSDLLKTRMLYGIDHDGGQFRDLWVSRQNELTQRHAAAHAAAEEKIKETSFLQGCIDSQQYYRQFIH